MKDDEEKNLKEPFCPICIAAVPLAFSVSTGTLVASTTDENCEDDERAKRRDIVMGCVYATIILLLIIGYFYVKKCKSCA
jgi:hypothetical protein